MSERGGTYRPAPRRGAFLALVLSIAPALHAQDDELALRRRLESARVNQKVAEASRREAARRPVTPVDSSWVDAGRIRFLVLPTPLREVEQQALKQGIADGLALLTARHGHRAAELVDTVFWHVLGRETRFAAVEPLTLRAGTNDVVLQLDRPIDRDVIAQAVLKHAGIRLRRAVPAIRLFAGDRPSLDDSEDLYLSSARELAMSWAVTARRCYGGSLGDCRRVLTEPDTVDRLATWFDSADHRDVALYASAFIPITDTTRRAQRQRCVDGDRATCSRFAATNLVIYPWSTDLRASLVREAFALGDTLTYERLLAQPADAEMIGRLADAAGVSADSLIASWARHARAALDASQSSSVLLLVCAIGWSLVLVGIAGAKRLS